MFSSYILVLCVLSITCCGRNLASPVCGNFSDPGLINRTTVALDKATGWLSDQRLFDGRWPYISTQTAIFSLQIANPSWFAALERDTRTLVSDRLDFELLGYLMPGYKSNFRDLEIGGGVLAQYVLALQSVCSSTTNFYGVDLPQVVNYQTRRFPVDNFNNFFQYSLAVIALCSSGSGRLDGLVEKLIRGPRGGGPCATYFGHAPAGNSGHNTDILSMMVMAMSCARDKVNHRTRRRIDNILRDRVRCIKNIQKPDGSFGNSITTALAAQALISVNKSPDSWRCSEALQFVLDAQDRDGSFGDLGSTIQILPLLAGRTHASLENIKIQCPSDLQRPQPPTIHPGNSTLNVTLTIENLIDAGVGEAVHLVEILEGENVYHAMLRAEEATGGIFRFDSAPSQWGQSLQSINGVAKNPSKRQYWTIRIGPEREWAPKGIEGLYPEVSGEEYIFQLRQF